MRENFDVGDILNILGNWLTQPEYNKLSGLDVVFDRVDE